jgi:hypothetical protein
MHYCKLQLDTELSMLLYKTTIIKYSRNNTLCEIWRMKNIVSGTNRQDKVGAFTYALLLNYD